MEENIYKIAPPTRWNLRFFLDSALFIPDTSVTKHTSLAVESSPGWTSIHRQQQQQLQQVLYFPPLALKWMRELCYFPEVLTARSSLQHSSMLHVLPGQGFPITSPCHSSEHTRIRESDERLGIKVKARETLFSWDAEEKKICCVWISKDLC